jgi:hypothetical protein
MLHIPPNFTTLKYTTKPLRACPEVHNTEAPRLSIFRDHWIQLLRQAADVGPKKKFDTGQHREHVLTDMDAFETRQQPALNLSFFDGNQD